MEPAAAAGGFFAPPQPSAPAAQAGGPETASELLERMLMRGTGVGGVGTIRIPFGATGIHFIPAENEDDSENTPTDAASDGDARRPRSSRPRIRVLRPDRRPEIFDSLSGALAHAFRDLVRSIGQNIHLQGQPPASEAAVAALEVVTFPVEVAKGCKMLSPLCVVCQEAFEVHEVEEGGSSQEGFSSGTETQDGREVAVAVTNPAQEESNAHTDGADQPPAENTERLEVGLKMPCGHVFHAECLKPWLKNSNTCPTCRYEIMTDNEDYNAGAKRRMEARAAAAAAASAAETATASGDGDVGMDEADEAGPSESRKRRREDAEVEDDQGEGEGSAERAAPRVRSS
ncbi:hypothetical protein DFJ73DRAFT_57784 [Zopfochytrium polystomum]|nr:hypothetical protein DFJ73DRAFT_57784 [Zopfochytrium polystomum]